MRVRRSPVLLIAVALCLLLPGVAGAQTTGMLRGLVTDEDGRPLSGATIAIASSGQVVTGRGAVTDEGGAFFIPSLPPSRDYVVQAAYPGCAIVTLSQVEVAAGQTTTVRLTLQPLTTFRERIEVRARPQIVNLETGTRETRFSAEFIEALPILGRNYQDILALAPGVTDVDGDGNPNIHGARDTDVVTLVDGVSTTDPLTGKFGAQLNIESIQEIEVKTSGAPAEFSRAQGGFANILTKSGGNEFQGTFKFFWRGAALDGDGAGTDDPRLHFGLGENGLRDLSFNDYLPFLSLEGPIVRDRAWFFMAHELVRMQEPVNALNSAFVTGRREFREFVKLTWQAGANHRLAFSLNYDPQEFTNQGLNSFTREESGFTLRQGGPILTLKATSVLSPNVALETSLSSFDERPRRSPTLGPDTNFNGVLFTDFNGNGFIEASERDAGEDFDGDGRFDVFEDFLRPIGFLNPEEDRDGDGVLTPRLGCEGRLREDVDCDGRLDNFVEDQNGNGRLDVGEDIDHDGRLDPGTEDRNGNRRLDDTPFPRSLYPYGSLTPEVADRDYTIDQRLGTISGPYYEEFSDKRRRFTLRQDLGVYVPDYWGSHDLKTGFVLERENFDRETRARAIMAPVFRSRREGASTLRAIIPADTPIDNTATGLITGLYLQDTYKPFPNLSIGLGLRFDRELSESFGYTYFEPAAERALFDRLSALFGIERGRHDFLQGDNNGVISQGILSDPIFQVSDSAAGETLNALRVAALSRLTRHHIELRFSAADLAQQFPEIKEGGEVDPVKLALHGITPQQREKFTLTNNNLAPRLSIAWDPWSNGRTKVFGTWGRYYDKLFLSTIVGEEGPDNINRYYLLDADGVTGSGIPNHNVGRTLSKAPPSANQVDRALQTPFSDEFTLGFEREIAPDVALSIAYINRRYRQQLQDIDVNHTLRPGPGGAPLDLFGGLLVADAGGGVALPTKRVPDGRPDLYIHNFFFNQVLRVGNFNEARYRGIEVALLKRLARRWELQGSYTYSRAVGAAESFQSRLGNDPSTIESEFGYLDFDQRHVVKLNLMAFLPRDWQIGSSVIWSSGLPYSVLSRYFAFDNVDYQQYRTTYGVTVFDPGPRFVSLRRNLRRNDPVYDINVSAKKALVLGRTSAAVFVEVFNLLNTDDLRIFTYEPDRTSGLHVDESLLQGPLQLDAVRRFGRRFQVGFQIEF
jgi:hypothetical protein